MPTSLSTGIHLAWTCAAVFLLPVSEFICHQSCRTGKALFPWCPPSLLAFTFFCLLLHRVPEPPGKGFDGGSAFRMSAPTFLTVHTMYSCCHLLRWKQSLAWPGLPRSYTHVSVFLGAVPRLAHVYHFPIYHMSHFCQGMVSRPTGTHSDLLLH